MADRQINNSLERQVFPPGYVGDALYAAGKLPGELGNLWGKVKSMMPMNADAQNVFPQRAGMQMPPQQAPLQQPPGQQMLRNPEAGGFGMRSPVMPQPGMPQPGMGQPQQLPPAAPPMPPGQQMLPGGPPQPPNAMQPPWGAMPGRQANPGIMPARFPMQGFQPQPMPAQPNIFANRAMAY